MAAPLLPLRSPGQGMFGSGWRQAPDRQPAPEGSEPGWGWQPGVDPAAMMAAIDAERASQPMDERPIGVGSDPAAVLRSAGTGSRRRGMMFGGVVPDAPSIAPTGPLQINQAPPVLPAARKPGLLQKGGLLGDGSALRAALLGFFGGPGVAQMINQRKQREFEEQADERRYQRSRADHLDDREYEANKPQYFMSGEDRWMLDPRTGQARIVADAPQDYQEYAAAMGYQPGTPEYQRAMTDWVLRSSGPTATDNDLEIEGARQGNREALEGVRQRNRLAVRGTPTWRQTNPLPRAGTGRGTGRNSGTGRPTATGPNGAKLEWDGKAWVPAT